MIKFNFKSITITIIWIFKRAISIILNNNASLLFIFRSLRWIRAIIPVHNQLFALFRLLIRLNSLISLYKLLFFTLNTLGLFIFKFDSLFKSQFLRLMLLFYIACLFFFVNRFWLSNLYFLFFLGDFLYILLLNFIFCLWFIFFDFFGSFGVFFLYFIAFQGGLCLSISLLLLFYLIDNF